MKTIITATLIALAQIAYAEPLSQKCHEQAINLVDAAFYSALDEIPNSASIEGFNTDFSVLNETDSHVTLQTSGDFYDSLSKIFWEEGTISIEIVLNSNCEKTSLKLKQQTTDFVYVDQPEGPACHLELGLQCDDDMIDRCIAYPKKATNHQCVPKRISDTFTPKRPKR